MVAFVAHDSHANMLNIGNRILILGPAQSEERSFRLAYAFPFRLFTTAIFILFTSASP